MSDYGLSPSALCPLLPADKYIITDTSLGDIILKYLKQNHFFPLWQNAINLVERLITDYGKCLYRAPHMPHLS